jgi:ankyrin repeat protein
MKFWPAVLALALFVQGCASPLHQAAMKGEKYKVIELLDKGAKVDAKDSHGRTPLFLAAEFGNLDTVQELLKRGADPTKGALLSHGDTPLHVAARNGLDKVIELLLTKYTNADVQNSSRQTPLMLAAWGRHPQTVTLLIKSGADVYAMDRYGWTALHTPWDAAPADPDYSAVMEILVANKANVNVYARIPPGYTPLMGAAMVGDKNTVELLLEKGARANDVDGNGQTAYTMAAEKNWTDVMTILADRGGTRYTATPTQGRTIEPEPEPESGTSDSENPQP